jgi:2-dehydro-3-deoxygluconokinase
MALARGAGNEVSPLPDVVALGETMLSLVALDAPLGSAATLHMSHGGAESNACVALVRLGLRAAWVSRLGRDPAGDRVLAELETNGVDLRWVRRDPDRPTGLMLRDTLGNVRYYRSGSAASALSPADLEGVPVEEARAVLVTGITSMLGRDPGRAAITLFDRATGIRALDPNLRPGLWGSDRAAELIVPLVTRCDLLLGGESELRLFAGNLEGAELARACSALGPREVVVRRGGRGAGVLLADGRWLEHTPPPAPDIDPVGAGDAFNAGYLAAKLEGAEPEDVLERAAALGAIAASTRGDTGALPSQDDP